MWQVKISVIISRVLMLNGAAVILTAVVWFLCSVAFRLLTSDVHDHLIHFHRCPSDWTPAGPTQLNSQRWTQRAMKCPNPNVSSVPQHKVVEVRPVGRRWVLGSLWSDLFEVFQEFTLQASGCLLQVGGQWREFKGLLGCVVFSAGVAKTWKNRKKKVLASFHISVFFRFHLCTFPPIKTSFQSSCSFVF